MKRDTAHQFSPTTLILHWLVGLTMIALLAVGTYMVETKSYGLFSWHKSFGLFIFAAVLVRVVWRMKNGWPTPVGQYRHVEHLVAKIIHWLLIIATLLMPISGFLNSALGGYGVEFFGWELVTKNVNPENPQAVLAYSDHLYVFFHNMHRWVGNLLIVSIALHVAGALKHHVIDKDGTLRRMLGAKI